MRRFLGRPLCDFTNRAVELEDVFGPAARRLLARLYDARTWDERFDVLDEEIAARVANGHELKKEVSWTWQRLVQTGGRLPSGPTGGRTLRS